VQANWCYKVTHKKSNKEGQARAESGKAISEHQPFNGKHKDRPKSRRFMEAYQYKEKNANGVPRSYIICIDGDKPDPIPTENQDFWETPLNGDQFHYDNKEVYQTLLAWINDGLAATYAMNHKTTLNSRSLWLDLVNAYEGEDAKQLAISAAQNTIATTYFTHESMNFTFTDYCNKHMATNNDCY